VITPQIPQNNGWNKTAVAKLDSGENGKVTYPL
jgi:hypothetical protein